MKLKEEVINKTFITSNGGKYFKIRLISKDSISKIDLYLIWKSKYGEQLTKIITIKNNKITH